MIFYKDKDKDLLISIAESHVTKVWLLPWKPWHVSNGIKIGRSARFHSVRHALRKSLFRVDIKKKCSITLILSPFFLSLSIFLISYSLKFNPLLLFFYLCYSFNERKKNRKFQSSFAKTTIFLKKAKNFFLVFLFLIF